MLSPHQLVHLEGVSRVLLSPLAAPGPDAWRAEAAASLRRLFEADYAVFGFSLEPAPFVCDGFDAGLWMQYAEHVSANQSGWGARDLVVERWLQLQRSAGRGAFTEAQMEETLRPYDLSVRSSELLSGVAPSLGLHGARGLTAAYGESEAGIQLMYASASSAHARDLTSDLMLLRVLLPSLQAGLDAMLRFSAHRHTLDAITEPLAAFDVDGRLLHQNRALSSLLAAEPERARIEVDLRLLAHRLRILVFPRRQERSRGPAPEGPAASREIKTARGYYTLRGLLLPSEGAFGEAFVVSVSLDAPPALPDAEAVSTRHGLTKREAEVALLLASGLANAAIAERLFISPHTARRHVENVLGKLGLNSRSAVAARLLGTA